MNARLSTTNTVNHTTTAHAVAVVMSSYSPRFPKRTARWHRKEPM